MAHILALDQGTTSSRAILFDEGGKLLAIEQQEFPQNYPRPGWVEHDAEAIWQSQLETASKVLQQASLKPADVAALGITNQRETVVVWDRQTGEPIHPAIVWQDRRTADICNQLREAGHEATITEKTGLIIDPYFSATKLAWILDHVDGARPAAEAGKLAAGTIDTWLLYRLSGQSLHVTDYSNASRTSLMNLESGQWDDELLELFGVPRNMMPEIHASSETLGKASDDLPLAGIPLAGVAGDQQAALFGQACFEPGQLKNTYGTGCFLLMHTGDQPTRSSERLLSTRAAALPGGREFVLEGSIFTGGAVVSWLRDGLGIIKNSADVEPLAESTPDSGEVFLVPAFAGLGAPHWDPFARGTILGLTAGSTAAHIARAAIESIAYQVADVIEAMWKDAGQSEHELRVDGGACVNNSLLQFQADILQLPVVRPEVTETTALGAAYLAGLAEGVWSNRQEVASQWRIERRFEPKMSSDEAATRRQRWKQAVERSLEWARDG